MPESGSSPTTRKAPPQAGEQPAVPTAPPAPPSTPALAPGDPAPMQGSTQDRLERARKLLTAAMRKPEATTATAKPLPSSLKVDKYFGDRLPPVCAQLGCYVTDDGKRFYCVNPACQKHKRRETKHTRRGNPVKPRIVYFRCPRCDSSSIEMHLLSNRYVCRSCKYNWQR